MFYVNLSKRILIAGVFLRFISKTVIMVLKQNEDGKLRVGFFQTYRTKTMPALWSPTTVFFLKKEVSPFLINKGNIYIYLIKTNIIIFILKKIMKIYKTKNKI